MTRTLATNLYQAAKLTYIPASKMNKEAKQLPIMHHARLRVKNGVVEITTIDTTGETWELVTETAPARTDEEFETLVPMRPLRDWLGVTAKYKSVLVLSLDTRTQTLTVKEESELAPSRTEFKCIDALEFPSHLKTKESPCPNTL